MIAATSCSSHSIGAIDSVAPKIAATEPPADWQRALADAFTDPAALLEELQLEHTIRRDQLATLRNFGLRVPRGFVARMERGNPDDPLLKQVLPLAAEMQAVDGFNSDPVGDLASRTAPGVLHKYHGRALLITTGACAVHCRYCFRRHFPYAEHSTTRSHWQAALDYLRDDPSIVEVLLSGGDPLSLTDRRLAELGAAIEDIPHVRRLRIHTRQPIVLPERVDDGLCRWLQSVRLQKVVVLHANHAREIDRTVRTACARLAACDATLLNQSVLLAGINDSATALADLSESLLSAGVLPYYINLLDRVQGAAHFDVPESRAVKIMAELTARLPGYLVPKLVRELPGMHSKTPVTHTR